MGRISNDIIDKEIYKNRLTEFFNNYKSKNFEGASWSTLNQVIMASIYIIGSVTSIY